jgi:mono/diheme cytochrome c family protein
MKVEPGSWRRFDLALLVVLGLGGLPAAGCYGKSNEAGPAVAVDVEALYAQMCARCHGPDGRGDPEMKKTIPGIRDFSDPAFRARGSEDVEAVIMTGRNQMPGFGGALTRPKIQHLGGYVRRLGDLAAAGAAPAATGATAPGAGAAPARPGAPQ